VNDSTDPRRISTRRPPRKADWPPFWRLVEAVAELGPLRLRVLEKSRFARAMDAVGRPLGLGLTGFDAFSWAGTVFLAERMFGTRAGYLLLRHEAVHLADQRRVGLVPFILSYLLFLPTGVTCRALWEWRGYRETLRAYFERGPKLAERRANKILREFAGKRYLYMWPFRGMVKRWIERELERLEKTGGQCYPGMERLALAYKKAPQSERGESMLTIQSIIDTN
jgi:hypothetical protein